MAVNPEDIHTGRTISISLDGKQINGYQDETIFNVAKREGIWIPHLCYKDGMRPDGNCRVCMVEIEGERTLQPSCVRTITEGMVINTKNNKHINNKLNNDLNYINVYKIFIFKIRDL